MMRPAIGRVRYLERETLRIILFALALLVGWLWFGPQHTNADSKRGTEPKASTQRRPPLTVDVDVKRRVIRAEAPAPDWLVTAKQEMEKQNQKLQKVGKAFKDLGAALTDKGAPRRE